MATSHVPETGLSLRFTAWCSLAFILRIGPETLKRTASLSARGDGFRCRSTHPTAHYSALRSIRAMHYGSPPQFFRRSGARIRRPHRQPAPEAPQHHGDEGGSKSQPNPIEDFHFAHPL